ncbi:hypothetical protein J5N97_005494 [Dioscorea zingiberensis]|uniref:Protein kinase domain-containing protein n=1 Tax=Dioscorea zingiberensis TaxID=325984 RepID=A0A9D5HSB4_9LILI|nr:hypothetical protein J5N97_005494 [Dioscorea zingiberensis]
MIKLRNYKLYLNLLMILFFISLSTTKCENLTFSLANFTKANTGPDFNFSNDAEVTQWALQITPDSSNAPESYLVNKSGRVIYNTPFQLWQPLNSTTNRAASFNTSFTFNVNPIVNTPNGEGLAFAILPTLDEPPPASHGGYLGLTNETLDGNPLNKFIAIEFDTVKQLAYDPDDNHVGLDINSVKSNATTSLKPLGIEIALNATKYTVWIDYDGAGHRIDVFMALEGVAKPGKPALSQPLDISQYVSQWSYFGFSASTSTRYELHCVLAWNLTIEILPEPKKGRRLLGWHIAVIVVGSLAGLALTGFIISLYMRRKKVGDDPSVLVGTLKSLPGTPKEFEFKELKKATNNFDENLKLGQGGFGIVYKGVLAEENTEVAVKMFSRSDKTKCQDDFLHELTIINRLRHKRLVKLLGWCHKNGLLLLVYEYMPNGSLDHHLFGGADRPLLPWDRRYTIITGVASALHYLHNEYDQRVVHRDLKASNIMLDSAFNARLGDFGLARALETDKTSYAEIELGGVPGTMGYIAPECFHTGKATSESDLFAFGAVVLETVCGRRPRCDVSGFQFLVDWVWKLHREGRLLDAVDRRLAGEFDGEEARRLLLLGMACSHPAAGERPKTEVVVQIIYGAVEPPKMPPFRPAFVWPSAVVDDLGSTSTSTMVTSSYYGSSAAGTPQCWSKEAHASTPEEVSMR